MAHAPGGPPPAPIPFGWPLSWEEVSKCLAEIGRSLEVGEVLRVRLLVPSEAAPTLGNPQWCDFWVFG